MSAVEFVRQVDAGEADALVVDIGLPDADGRDVVQALRARGVGVPVIFLTARDALPDRLAGFASGGDDYLTKPFHFAELVARLQALIKRGGADSALEVGGCGSIRRATTPRVADASVKLTPTEFRILARLGAAPGDAVRRRELVARRVAARRDRPRQHARRVHREAAPKARDTSRRAGDRDRSRRRLLPAMRRPRLGVRARLLLAVIAAVALALVVSVAAFTLLLSHRLSASATSLARAQAQAALSSLEVREGRLVAPEAADQGTRPGQVWVFSGLRQLEAPNASADLSAAARALARGPERAKTWASRRGSTHCRWSRTARALGRSSQPCRSTRTRTPSAPRFVGALILAGLLLGAVALLSRWMLGRALEPVSRMTADAVAWSATDLDRRFHVGEPYDELTRLAATLDDLLEQIAASLRHEQRFTAELSHELRTPLARISGETELMLRRDRTRTSTARRSSRFNAAPTRWRGPSRRSSPPRSRRQD